MNNENKYQFINNLPKEYHRVLWNIMIKAECNHFVNEPERLSKQECKLIMRFLYKLFDKIKQIKEKYEQLEEENIQLKEENKQLKEQLENDIDRYEDTISYQLGFDKGKEYLQQIIDNAIEYIKNILKWVRLQKDWETEKILLNLLILLGDKENE